MRARTASSGARKRARLLAPGSGADRRRRLAFEIVPCLILGAVSGMWAYVALLGTVLLPGVRSTWVWWIRHGPGAARTALAAAVATVLGAGAVVVVVLTACAIGIVRLWRSPEPSGDQALAVSRR